MDAWGLFHSTFAPAVWSRRIIPPLTPVSPLLSLSPPPPSRGVIELAQGAELAGARAHVEGAVGLAGALGRGSRDGHRGQGRHPPINERLHAKRATLPRGRVVILARSPVLARASFHVECAFGLARAHWVVGALLLPALPALPNGVVESARVCVLAATRPHVVAALRLARALREDRDARVGQGGQGG
eukprot:CAMPEP_0206262316 /NCGR_PEP_ID=MMETSP0047_2-20121206/28168_1 /ASSEMBLY_ACC=CAM_ASM_000192 /TAXON_ID=195065 /ORGANISM="Chroomonas mesostigmatica_cf, Strain CCMP1168" /LENGTH=186 /DNA_ID=CAMNT_0053689679 /DNA_START=124 /DNA_END=680 /DNA_ORIENTATION=-